MDVNRREYLSQLTEQVIGACYEVSNILGCGFLEKVYERALMEELRVRDIRAGSSVALPVHYKGVEVGMYYADILVEGALIVELKCCEAFCDEHMAQCINYLKATGMPLALLVNFQKPRVEWRRVFFKY